MIAISRQKWWTFPLWTSLLVRKQAFSFRKFAFSSSFEKTTCPSHSLWLGQEVVYRNEISLNEKGFLFQLLLFIYNMCKHFEILYQLSYSSTSSLLSCWHAPMTFYGIKKNYNYWFPFNIGVDDLHIFNLYYSYTLD